MAVAKFASGDKVKVYDFSEKIKRIESGNVATPKEEKEPARDDEDETRRRKRSDQKDQLVPESGGGVVRRAHTRAQRSMLQTRRPRTSTAELRRGVSGRHRSGRKDKECVGSVRAGDR